MARTTSITFDQVAAAANAIKAANEKPTARRVREALGTGSMATILKFFQQWQGGAVVDADDEQEIVLDPAIVKAITTAIAAQVAAAAVDAAQKIKELEEERQSLMQEVERLTVDVDAYEAETRNLRVEAANLAGQVIAIRSERERIQIQLDDSDKREKTINAANELLKAKLEELPKLKNQLSSCRDLIEHLQHEKAQAEQQSAVATAQNAELVDRLAEAKQRAELDGALLLQSRENAERLSRELTAELRGKTAAEKPVAKQIEPAAPATKKARPSRAKPKTMPSPASV